MRNKDVKFEEFMEDIELVSAPDSFSDKLMDKIESGKKLSPARVSSFLYVYMSSVAAIILYVLIFGENMVSGSFANIISSYFSGITINTNILNTNAGLILAFSLATVFVFLWGDSLFRNEQSHLPQSTM